MKKRCWLNPEVWCDKSCKAYIEETVPSTIAPTEVYGECRILRALEVLARVIVLLGMKK